MNMKKLGTRTAALLVVAVLFSLGAQAAAPAVSAQSAILMDADTGRVLYEKDAHRRSLIASTTKIMTAVVVLEQCDLTDRVQVQPEAVGIEGSSMYLREGEILSVKELLYGLMLQSGNDAAVALAIYCGGTAEDFVSLMNDKAARLGLTDTHFGNPNGLDAPDNYATALDMARLTAYALQNQDFRTIVAAKTATAGDRTLVNHNKLLWRYEGAIGVKTGYTREAGRILVSAAERDGRTLIAVTFNAPSDWNDHAALLDYGFMAFSVTDVVMAGQALGTAAVVGGTAETVSLVAADPVTAALAAEEQPEVRLFAPRMVYAPVRAGETAGYAEVWLGDRLLGTTALQWAETVESIPDE
jgi:D-alanyl-D-alanine carboxypeptidase